MLIGFLLAVCVACGAVAAVVVAIFQLSLHGANAIAARRRRRRASRRPKPLSRRR